jgi:hypothetical protein
MMWRGRTIFLVLLEWMILCRCSLSSNQTEKIWIVQSSDPDYNRQTWEIDLPWTLVELSQLDVFNYAEYHHYHYKRSLIDEHLDQDCHPVWSKVYGLSKAFQEADDNDLILLLDLDIFFMDSQMSIYDKLNEWDPERRSLVYMPSDPDEENNYLIPSGSEDEVLNVNTGFQLWKVNSLTRELVQKWKTCLTEIPGCKRWDYQWPFDQGAFNEFIRPIMASSSLRSSSVTVSFTDEIVPPLTEEEEEEDDDRKEGSVLMILPCDEANGFPSHYENYVITQPDGRRHELGNHNCHGRFVSHFWEETKRHNHERLREMIFDKIMRQKLRLIRP